MMRGVHAPLSDAHHDDLDARYELLDRIGQGGAALVYRARQRSTGQDVAIKVLRQVTNNAESDRQEWRARFRREMNLLGQLRHPNIVRLIDAGAVSDGRMYLVTELVDGQTLARLIDDEGPLSLARTRPLLLQVLDALAGAHERGLVHRDIKPQNIMVSRSGLSSRATLLDFGVATITEAHRPEGFEALTLAGAVVGTLSYVAPEVLSGEPATPASDLWAWGLVLLECLTGDVVYGGGAGRAALVKLLGPQPVPIPDELAAAPIGEVLGAVLQKDPARRAQSAAEVYRALERCPLG